MEYFNNKIHEKIQTTKVQLPNYKSSEEKEVKDNQSLITLYPGNFFKSKTNFESSIAGFSWNFVNK